MSAGAKDKHVAERAVVICVCGMAGSGKSRLAKSVARVYGLRYFSGGDALKLLAIERGYRPSGRGWWEGPEGMRFLRERNADPEFDRKVDAKLLAMAREGNVVLDSWTMPWLVKDGFNIWLEASSDVRAKRVAGRDGINPDEALKALVEKENCTKAIYKKLYGFSLGVDLSPFDLVLDTNGLEAEEVFHAVCRVLDNVVFRSGQGRNR